MMTAEQGRRRTGEKEKLNGEEKENGKKRLQRQKGRGETKRVKMNMK